MAIKITKKSAQDLVREAPAPIERSAVRQRRFKGATLVFNDVASNMACRLRDISDTGAGLECENTATIPDQVLLRLGDGQIFDAVVAWRTPTRLGLRFVDNAALIALMRDFSRQYRELQPGLRNLLDLLAGAADGGQGRLGQPNLAAALKRLADQGEDLLASFGQMIEEIGDPSKTKT